MENVINGTGLTLKEYYNILKYSYEGLLEDPDNEMLTIMFADAAAVLANSDCGHLFPEDLLASDVLEYGAAKNPSEGTIVTSVVEDGEKDYVVR